MRPINQKAGTALALHLAVAFARNQAKGLGLIDAARSVLGRGGHRWSKRTLEETARLVSEQYLLLAPALPSDMRSKVGVEIGPGDHTGLADCFVSRGAMMYAVEKLAPIDLQYSARLAERLRSMIGGSGGTAVSVSICRFEEFWPPADVDFVYSNDALEHVGSPREVFQHCYRIMKPGGRMAHSIDLAGHQIGDIAHLCCPDWLWRLAYSNVETTNRTRLHEFADGAREAGFSDVSVRVLRSAPVSDIARIRPRILARWKEIPDEELGALQILLDAVKPSRL